jgi:hypothetical protein
MTDTMTAHQEDHYTLCEDCEKDFAIHEFVGSEDKVWKLCDACNDEAHEYCEMMEGVGEEEEEEEDLGCCVSCKTAKATIVFMHMKNGNFELCDACFEWADHEDDYGKQEAEVMDSMMKCLRG